MESVSRISIKKFILLMAAFVLPWILVFVIGETSIGYSVSLDNKCIAYVKSKVDVDKAINDIKVQMGSRVKVDDIKDKIKCDIIFSNRENFINGEELKKNILNSINTQIKAYIMKVDGKNLAYVLDDKEGQYIVENVKQHYINNLKDNKSSVVSCDLKNKISYDPIELKVVNVKDLQQSLLSIIESEGKSPIFNVQIKVNKKESVEINPALYVKTSMDMEIGNSKIESDGETGLKDIIKEVVYVNSKLVSEKTVSEKIIKSPKDKVVIKGGKIPLDKEVAFIEQPSRGTITSNFGARWGTVHKGIDIAGNTGDPIKAPLDGKVTYSGWMEGYGYVVILDHGNGFETRYGHCSKLIVKKNDNVKKGDIIALIGSTGKSTGPHLHFEVRKNGEAINPINYIIK